MKTYTRLLFITIALPLTMTACKGNGSANAGDSTRVLDSSSTIKVDSTVKHDTSKKDAINMNGDTSKRMDTIHKTTVKTTEVKKSSSKKHQ
ncbi:MAG TPA: hypothetical protein VFE54_03100 [Mucilaginibacter sp.]|jgi:hypothetical protein|nr:hypothetical protein [Mucilaginibacter sp.]